MRPTLFGTIAGSTPTPFNVALASNGATATAESTFGTWTPAKTNNGFRNTQNDGPNYTWASTHSPPTGGDTWLVNTFAQSYTISEINVIGLKDELSYDTDPTLSTVALTYPVIDFAVQYWDGGAWVTIESVTGNNKVWRQFTFAPIATTKIRVLITSAAALGNTFLVEVEAWGY